MFSHIKQHQFVRMKSCSLFSLQ